MPKQTIGAVKVHTFPLPPRHFNVLNATGQDLRRYGFPHRPDPLEMPRAAEKWVTFARQYGEFEHIEPEFRALENRHAPNLRTQTGTEGQVNATSKNWSGSVLFIGSNNPFIWIWGSWSVPHVYPTPGSTGTEYSSAWLGIDGDGSPDVMQAGTETDSDGSCYAWSEWYPNYSVGITNFPVSPGDVVSIALCAEQSHTDCALFMANVTSKTYTSLVFSAPQGTTLQGNCAEAIVERPEIGSTLAQLPRYGDVFFDDTVAFARSGTECDIGLGTPMSMLADDGTTQLSAAVFESDTDSLKVQYTGP